MNAPSRSRLVAIFAAACVLFATLAAPRPAAAAPEPAGWDLPAMPIADTGVFVPIITETFTTNTIVPPGSTADGWSYIDFDTTGIAAPGFDPVTNALFARVWPNDYQYRITGVLANRNEWLPYAQVGSANYVRAKYYIYATSAGDPTDANTVPNLRLRLSNRFAVNSMLEVFHHLAADPSNTSCAAELRPSADPSRPSIYRVDFDPVDVPILSTNPGEGVLRGMEAYAMEPQENGVIGMTESVLGVYPAAALPDSASSSILRKVFAPTATNAGNLAAYSPDEVEVTNLLYGTYLGDMPAADWSDSVRPSYFEAGTASAWPSPGITLDTASVAASRVGLVRRELNPGSSPTDADYLRVEEGKQYKVRFHLTSTQQSNKQANIRLRCRSVKFGWSQKFEIGGAWAAGMANNRVAWEALPGTGCQNPDKIGSEAGGWYTLLFNTPLHADIRPEFPPGTPLSERMPNLTAQPGPGDPAPSRRDLRVGLDLLDTLSGGIAVLEQGNLTCDRVEVRVYNTIPD